ncbi:hypothetical protein MMC25_004114 [Agyrium rufum]|nr:hypothetical protein [Agyrium rufum]
MAETATRELMKALKGLLLDRERQSSQYADLTIFCGNDVHKVHKVIVCSRSDFFTGACRVGEVCPRIVGEDHQKANRLPMRKESLKGEITLEEDDPPLVALMVDYFYELDYDAARASKSIASPAAEAVENDDEIPPVEQVDEAPVEKNVFFGESVKEREQEKSSLPSAGMFSQGRWPNPNDSSRGERHPIPGFEVVESEREHDGPHLSVHAHMYALGDRYGIAGLKAVAASHFEECLHEHWNSDSFSPAIHIVWQTTPESDRELRDQVVDTIRQHMRVLDRPDMEAPMRELKGLAYEVLRLKCRDERGAWS